MKTVGITGGIGSGKSVVSKVFSSLGIPCYYADDRARELMVENAHLKAGLISILDENAYMGSELNRKYVAEKIFSNDGLRGQVNKIVHAKVGEDFAYWVTQQSSPYILKEAALLYETGSFKELDQIIVVYADDEERIRRVLKRDQRSKEQIEAIINKQLPQKEKIEKADFTIENNINSNVIAQVVKIHQQLIN